MLRLEKSSKKSKPEDQLKTEHDLIFLEKSGIRLNAQDKVDTKDTKIDRQGSISIK